jgi:hypothetical protein
MMRTMVLLAFAAAAATAQTPTQSPVPQQPNRSASRQESPHMETLTGRTIRWSFEDGPMAGTSFEHDFNADGSVTWRIIDGQHKGASAREKSYSAVKINAQTWAISYFAASGHTLTVVLSVEDGRAVAFASNNTTWTPMHGRFVFVR